MRNNKTTRNSSRTLHPISSDAKPSRTYAINALMASTKWRIVVASVLVIVIALIPSVYFYHQSQVAQQKLNGSTSTNLQTTAEVIKRISRHILLPSSEQPTLATVSDASKVRNQSFFANAANGDKVLVYAQAKKAFLYRPSIDKLIEVAPLAPNGSQ